jgi:hypothetical protein
MNNYSTTRNPLRNLNSVNHKYHKQKCYDIEEEEEEDLISSEEKKNKLKKNKRKNLQYLLDSNLNKYIIKNPTGLLVYEENSYHSMGPNSIIQNTQLAASTQLEKTNNNQIICHPPAASNEKFCNYIRKNENNNLIFYLLILFILLLLIIVLF